MALSLRNPEVENLARKVARRTGCTITQAIQHGLEVLDREMDGKGADLRHRLECIAGACADLPDLDTRRADEILGYDENGLTRHGD